jgi:hypothetical protein
LTQLRIKESEKRAVQAELKALLDIEPPEKVDLELMTDLLGEQMDADYKKY